MIWASKNSKLYIYINYLKKIHKFNSFSEDFSERANILIASSIISIRSTALRNFSIPFQFYSDDFSVPPCIINAFQFRPPVDDEIKQSRPVSVRAAADKW